MRRRREDAMATAMAAMAATAAIAPPGHDDTDPERATTAPARHEPDSSSIPLFSWVVGGAARGVAI